MVQAARSGVQNMAEGSQASGTSKKTELKLTNVARASLEELRLDFEDFLRQRALALWPPNHPALKRFKAKRCLTLEEVRAWVDEERKQAKASTDKHGRTQARVAVTGSATAWVARCVCSSSSAIRANAALSPPNPVRACLCPQLVAQA